MKKTKNKEIKKVAKELKKHEKEDKKRFTENKTAKKGRMDKALDKVK